MTSGLPKHQLDLDESIRLETEGVKIELVGQRDNYLLVRVPPTEAGHRTVDSWVFACYPDRGQAQRAARRLAGGLSSALREARASVADPDLGLGDWGVDVFGDPSQLPAVIQRNLAAVESGEFVMAWRGVSPRELSDETMSWLASTPSPLSSVRPQDAHRRYFRLERGGSLVRVIDANRMKWENAVVAALKAGVAGREMTEEEAEDELPSYRWSYLPSSYQPNGCEFKAPRRARGTAPVSESLYERWLGLLDALGCTQQDYPLPELAVDAVRVVEEMSAKYHDLKSRGQHPPSARQLEYASNVAKALGIDVTFDRSSSRADVSEFLETHAAAARQMKAVHGSADRTARMKALLEAMLHGPQSAKELGSRLGLDATSVRNMLEGWRPSLVELGMAERVQTTYNGKRRVHYVATAKGERFARGSGDS